MPFASFSAHGIWVVRQDDMLFYIAKHLEFGRKQDSHLGGKLSYSILVNQSSGPKSNCSLRPVECGLVRLVLLSAGVYL